MIRVNHVRRSHKQDGQQNILRILLTFQTSKKATFFNYEAIEKCYHQYSKQYAIQNKSDKCLR